jgi:hypothetical protein
VTLSNVVDIANANLYVSGGATLSLPGVLNCNNSVENAENVWQASGTNSVLALGGLTSVVEPNNNCNDVLLIQALAGGQVNLGGLISMAGVVQVQSSGGGSEVNLSALQVFDGSSSCNYGPQLQPSGGGTILAGSLASLTDVNVVLGSGTLNLETVTNLSYTTLSVTNGAVTLSNVVDIANANLYVSGGATLSLPGVLNCNESVENTETVWQASGSNSVLALTGLTNLAEPNNDCNDVLLIQALAGGQVNLGGLISMAGVVQVQSSGGGSKVNLSALQVFAGSSSCNYGPQLLPSGGGTILTGQLESLTGVTVVLGGTGALNLSTVTNWSDTTLTVTNGSVTLNNTEMNGATLNVSGGAMLSLPGVVSFQAGCANVLWQASGAGSVLDLPALTNLQGSACQDTMSIQALSGGQVLLGDLQTIANGSVAFLSDDTGSIINLTNLSAFVLQSGQGSLTAENGGTILFNNQAFLLANVAINIPAGNPVLPPTLIASETLTLYGTAWHSYRVEEINTSVPGSPVITLLVPLTNGFEAIAAAPPTNIVFLVTDFVANPPILQMGLTPNSQVQLVLYGLTNATYQIRSATNLSAPSTWTSNNVVVMTNAFRIFPATLPTSVVLFYRAEQE